MTACLSGHLSQSAVTLGTVDRFCAMSHSERSLGQKGHLSVSRWQDPHSMAGRLRVGSGTSREPFLDSPLGYILRNWKILTLRKAWSQYKLGDPPQKKLLPKAGKGLRISLCSVLHGRQLESGFEGLMPCVSFFCYPVSCPPLSVSIRFPR